MNVRSLFLLLSVGFAASSTDDVIKSDKQAGEIVFSRGRKIYTSEHDIVNMYTPVSPWIKKAMDASEESEKREIGMRTDLIEKLFFIQGDYKSDGTVENKGLFVLKPETGEATKLLDNGADITSVLDADQDIKKVYFAATDGIYLYNAEKNTAEKYGSVTDNIISIAQTKTGDVIYALTAEKVLYKVTDNGAKKEKVDDVKNAHQIVLDIHDNLYFYDSEKHIFVKKYSNPTAPLIQIKDLPIHPNKIKLLKAMFDLNDSVLVVLDDRVILINSNGDHTDDEPFFQPLVPATARSLEGRIMFYLAFDKSIYEYNLLKIGYGENLENTGDDIHKRIKNAARRAHKH